MNRKYLFILGRNPELSTAELESFFRKNNADFRKIELINNGLLIELSSMPKKGIIEKLGGTISIGEVIAEGNLKEIVQELDKINLQNSKSNKLNYTVYNFESEIFEEIKEYLKKRFKEEKLKATEKKLTGSIKMQSGIHAGKASSNLIDEQFFAFKNCFGRIIESSDYKKIEERDMKKPERRNELAISPRLAKILINLSETKENETLLDPFCGIGVILEEALLQRIKVIGIDKDKSAIEGARKNLKWFKFDKRNYRLINEDSSQIKLNEKISGIAAEPDFGRLIKSPLAEEESRKILLSFEKLMAQVLNNLKRNITKGEKRIAFTAPLILTKNKKRIECDYKKISKSTGLGISKGFPINEFRESQIVGRSIIVMEA